MCESNIMENLVNEVENSLLLANKFTDKMHRYAVDNQDFVFAVKVLDYKHSVVKLLTELQITIKNMADEFKENTNA